AFRQHHYQVSPDRIGVEIGKGGDKLVPDILGQQIDQKDGDKLRKSHTQHYTRLAKSTHLPKFTGAEDLLDALRARGLKLALATSSKPDELETTFASAVVQWKGKFDV